MIHNNEAQTQQSYPSFPHAKVLNWPQQQSERCKASLISQVVFALAVTFKVSSFLGAVCASQLDFP